MESNTKIILFKKGEILQPNKAKSFIYHDFDNVYPRLKELASGDFEVIHDFAIEIKLITFD